MNNFFTKLAKKWGDKILKKEVEKLDEENKILRESAQLWEAHLADKESFYKSFQFELLYPDLLPQESIIKLLPYINTAILILVVALIIFKNF